MWRWFWTFFALALLDKAATSYEIQRVGLDVESNPIVHHWWGLYGVVAVIAFTMFMFFLLGFALMRLPTQRTPLIVKAVTVIFGALFIYHLFILEHVS